MDRNIEMMDYFTFSGIRQADAPQMFLSYDAESPRHDGTLRVMALRGPGTKSLTALLVASS
ncbi:hypothetical protein FHS10_000607 [Mucilaginibacter dorajii]|nr:hypothetical protein [Mucilaginibacter dorajii]